MADNEFDPPGWPFNEAPPPIPPAEPPRPPEAPTFEPPVMPAPPAMPAPPVSPTAPPPPPPAQNYPPPGQHYPPPATPTYPPPAAAAPPPAHQVGQPAPYSSPGQPPPPAYGQPLPPGYQPQPRKSSRSVLTTVLVILAVLAVGIGSCTVWFVATVKAPVDEANKFLAAVDQSDYAAAAAMVPIGCDGTEITPALLDSFFAGQPIEYNLNSSSITNNDATVSGSFSSPDGSATRIEIYLRDRDGWQVCGFRFS